MEQSKRLSNTNSTPIPEYHPSVFRVRYTGPFTAYDRAIKNVKSEDRELYRGITMSMSEQEKQKLVTKQGDGGCRTREWRSKASSSRRDQGNTTRSNTEAEKNTKTRCLVINNRSRCVHVGRGRRKVAVVSRSFRRRLAA